MKYAEFGGEVQLRMQLSGIYHAPRSAKTLYLPRNTHINPLTLGRIYRPVYAEMQGSQR
jgi:hypothetical protein